MVKSEYSCVLEVKVCLIECSPYSLRASHPNIVKMIEEYEDKTKVYLVIEL